MRKFTIAISFLFSTCAASFAQQHVADCLEKLIKQLPDDTVKANRLNDLVSKLQYLDPARAVNVADEAIALSAKINYPLGLATAYRLRGVLYVDRMVLDSGKLFYDKAYAIVKSSQDKQYNRQTGLLLHNYGAIYHKRQLYDSAAAKYTETIKIFTSSGQDELTFFPCTNLASIYTYLKDNQKALEYAKAAHEAAFKMNDAGRMISAVNSEMSIRLELGQYDSVLLPLKRNVDQAVQIQNYYQEGTGCNLLGKYYGYGKNRYDSAVYYLKQALTAQEKVNNEYEITNMIHNLGYYYKQWGRDDSAVLYLTKAMQKGETLGLDQVVQYSLENLVELEEKRGNTATAFRYLKKLFVVKDSLQVKNNREQVNELEARFQAEKKDNQIKLQQSAIRRKSILNYVVIGGATTLLIISLLTYRNYRQRQKLQQRRITELETEKKLAATEAVLKGEEQERTRLAKDLHDGLGGMLSGIKYSLNTMKGNLVMTPDNAQAFERSMDMLDSSIREMRRVAHNMMPEALVKFGLDTALRDFCNDINQSGALKINYQSIGLKEHEPEHTIAITIYRIVQELINNTLKHAAATTALVQVTRMNNTITITAEDDGKGFDTIILQRAGGIGWTNIQSRVDFLKGRIDVQSEKGRGTSVHIELNE